MENTSIVLPDSLRELIGTATWNKNNVGHSKTEVYKLTGLNIAHSAYLKISKVESLYLDKSILEWLAGKLPVPKVIAYENYFETEYLLMSEIKGLHGACTELLSQPRELTRLYAGGLKLIHGIPADDCPFNQSLIYKLQQARERMENGLVDAEDFEEMYKGFSTEELFERLELTKPQDEDVVFTHGDYCLPNIIIHDGSISGFIDLGRAGVADRYQDIALAIRSLRHNGLGDWENYFLEVYGITEIDKSKVDFYILLDEFF